MNLRQTAAVAALAAMRADDLIHRPEPIATRSLHGYWKSSRLRLRCWFAGLRTLPRNPAGNGSTPSLEVRRGVRLCRSIIVAELLTRVWSAVLTARSRTQSESSLEELVQHVFRGQLEGRQAVLRLVAEQQALPAREAESTDRFRQQVDRWSDVLIGPLLDRYGLWEFAVDPQRAAESVRHASSKGSGVPGAIDSLTLIGLSRAIPRSSRDDEPDALLDWAVVQSVLSAIEPLGESRLRAGRSAAQPITAASCAAERGRRERGAAGSDRKIRFADLRRRTSGGSCGGE